MKANITEIFSSIQGEGKYVGAKHIFVRFFGCNMRCVWCDTPDALGGANGQYEQYSLEAVYQKVDDVCCGATVVSLTGGEPLLQSDFIKAFLPYLKKRNLSSYLETNGIYCDALEDVIEEIDIVSMDIKLPSSTGEKVYWQEHENFLRIASRREVFVKTVISKETTLSDVLNAVEVVKSVDSELLFILQPNHLDLDEGIIKLCLEYQNECQKKLKNVRIIPQIHKFMEVR